jgi:hypothetical protein
LPLTEKQLDALSRDAFEEVLRAAIGSGYFSADELPGMSVLKIRQAVPGIGWTESVPLPRRFKPECFDHALQEFIVSAHKPIRTGPPDNLD